MLERYFFTDRIGDFSIFQYLQEKPGNIFVSFIYFIQQNYTVRVHFNAISKLVAFFIANIAGGGAEQFGNTKAFVEFTHVELDKRTLVGIKRAGHRFGQFGFANPAFTHE